MPSSPNFKYYLGLSYNSKNKKEGFELATQNAYYQLIRENFGIKTKIYKNLKETLQSTDYEKTLGESSSEILIVGLRRARIFFKENKSRMIDTWVLFKIKKQKIEEEISRLEILGKKIEREKELYEAVKNGEDVRKIKPMLKYFSARAKIKGKHLIHLAVAGGHKEIVGFFFEKLWGHKLKR